ncbi:MAG: thiamine pyrophosphate-dependent enzyme [Candidatus Dormibacteraceae bacterium]
MSQTIDVQDAPIPAYRQRILDPHGRLVEGAHPTLSDAETIEALRWMLFSRMFDARATGLQRQGRLGTVSPVKGQEASVMGVSMALDKESDWIFPSYREVPAVIRHGIPVGTYLAALMGKVMAGRVPDGVNALPTQVALATQIPQAVGMAWGLKLQHKPGVVVAFFGEGAASEGDFHEAMNLAGVKQVPIVFVLQNNGWAISTSRALQSAGEFYRRAEGYGFPGVQVDGNDVFAVYDAARDAVARARRGEGPTLIETITYRLSFHNTTDNPRAYLPEGWLEEAERLDPIARLTAYLRSVGHWDDATEEAMTGEIKEELDAAVEWAAAQPASTPEDVFAFAYTRPPERVKRQRQELLDFLGSQKSDA